MNVTFTATHTRAPYYNLWIIRELAIGALAIALITFSAYAVKDIALLSNVTKLNMAALPALAYKTILAVGVFLGFRTFVFRLIAGLIIKFYVVPVHIYPVHKRCLDGQNERIDNSWTDFTVGKTDLTWKAYDGKLIHGCQLDATEESNRYIIFCGGNNELYDAHSLLDWGKVRADGFNVILYHPPGYGESDGPRTPLSDFYALEAIIQHLQDQQIPLANIEIRAQSIGSCAASAVSAKYPVGQVALCVPLASVEGVMEHLADRNVPWIISKIGTYFLSSILRDIVYCDNAGDLAKSNVAVIDIAEAGNDEMMTSEYSLSEADKIFKACQEKIFQNKASEPHKDGGSIVTDGTRVLYLKKWPGAGHNGLSVIPQSD